MHFDIIHTLMVVQEGSTLGLAYLVVKKDRRLAGKKTLPRDLEITEGTNPVDGGFSPALASKAVIREHEQKYFFFKKK